MQQVQVRITSATPDRVAISGERSVSGVSVVVLEYLATPFELIPSIVTGGERPLGFTANNRIR